ncbi:MAG TPA: HipA family kinase [Candidatus Aquilonibacter sp.]|nr:HipA family kinase [Candidatus Aquilonibacter sp.]
MRGGAQAQLMRCADDEYYVVKFQNNPQGTRILANELLGTRLAGRMGLPVPATAVVEVRESLIEYTEDMVIQLGRGNRRCQAGLQFGSRYPGAPAETVVYDFLPDEQLREAENLEDFCGMLVFDKWTCNTNGRQAIFFRSAGESRYRAQMIDQGFCFNAGEWNFPDAPLRGLYARHLVYQGVRGIESFEPWLSRIEGRLGESALEEAAGGVPPEWYNSEIDTLEEMLEQLLRRRRLVRELIVSAWKSSAQPFPNWK